VSAIEAPLLIFLSGQGRETITGSFHLNCSVFSRQAVHGIGFIGIPPAPIPEWQLHESFDRDLPKIHYRQLAPMFISR
jgi:hypothetical protein